MAPKKRNSMKMRKTGKMTGQPIINEKQHTGTTGYLQIGIPAHHIPQGIQKTRNEKRIKTITPKLRFTNLFYKFDKTVFRIGTYRFIIGYQPMGSISNQKSFSTNIQKIDIVIIIPQTPTLRRLYRKLL